MRSEYEVRELRQVLDMTTPFLSEEMQRQGHMSFNAGVGLVFCFSESELCVLKEVLDCVTPLIRDEMVLYSHNNFVAGLGWVLHK